MCVYLCICFYFIKKFHAKPKVLLRTTTKKVVWFGELLFCTWMLLRWAFHPYCTNCKKSNSVLFIFHIFSSIFGSRFLCGWYCFCFPFLSFEYLSMFGFFLQLNAFWCVFFCIVTVFFCCFCTTTQDAFFGNKWIGCFFVLFFFFGIENKWLTRETIGKIEYCAEN